MARKAKTTDKVRVKLDFVLRFDKATDSQTMIDRCEVDAIYGGIGEALRSSVPGCVEIMSGALTTASLDYRKPRRM